MIPMKFNRASLHHSVRTFDSKLLSRSNKMCANSAFFCAHQSRHQAYWPLSAMNGAPIHLRKPFSFHLVKFCGNGPERHSLLRRNMLSSLSFSTARTDSVESSASTFVKETSPNQHVLEDLQNSLQKWTRHQKHSFDDSLQMAEQSFVVFKQLVESHLNSSSGPGPCIVASGTTSVPTAQSVIASLGRRISAVFKTCVPSEYQSSSDSTLNLDPKLKTARNTNQSTVQRLQRLMGLHTSLVAFTKIIQNRVLIMKQSAYSNSSGSSVSSSQSTESSTIYFLENSLALIALWNSYLALTACRWSLSQAKLKLSTNPHFFLSSALNSASSSTTSTQNPSFSIIPSVLSCTKLMKTSLVTFDLQFHSKAVQTFSAVLLVTNEHFVFDEMLEFIEKQKLFTESSTFSEDRVCSVASTKLHFSVISSFLKLVQSQQLSTVSSIDEIKQVLKQFQESNIPPASQLLNSALQAVQTLQDFVSSSPKTYSQQFTMFAEQLLSLLFKCGLHPDEATAILLLNLFAARSKLDQVDTKLESWLFGDRANTNTRQRHRYLSKHRISRQYWWLKIQHAARAGNIKMMESAILMDRNNFSQQQSTVHADDDRMEISSGYSLPNPLITIILKAYRNHNLVDHALRFFESICLGRTSSSSLNPLHICELLVNVHYSYEHELKSHLQKDSQSNGGDIDSKFFALDCLRERLFRVFHLIQPISQSAAFTTSISHDENNHQNQSNSAFPLLSPDVAAKLAKLMIPVLNQPDHDRFSQLEQSIDQTSMTEYPKTESFSRSFQLQQLSSEQQSRYLISVMLSPVFNHESCKKWLISIQNALSAKQD